MASRPSSASDGPEALPPSPSPVLEARLQHTDSAQSDERVCTGPLLSPSEDAVLAPVPLPPTRPKSTTADSDESTGIPELAAIVPFGPFHYKLLLLCGFGWALDNMWLSGMSFQRQAILDEFQVSTILSGVMSSLLFLGLFVGASFWGWVSDWRGRRFAFNATLAMAAGGAVLAALMPLFALLCVAIFVLGAGAGGNLPVDGSLFVEFMPSARRGFWAMILSSFWCLGGLLVTALCWATLPTLPGWLGWRVAIGGNAVLCALFFVVRRAVPESPRYLMLHGRHAEAAAVVREVARQNRFRLADDGQLQRALEHAAHSAEASGEEVPRSWRALAALFAPSLRRTTLTLLAVWFGMSLGFGFMNFFLPAVLAAKGLAALDVYLDALLYNVAGLPGAAVACWLVETRLGRKYTLVVFVALSSLSVVLFALVTARPAMIACSMLASLSTQVAYAVIYTYTPEVYPTSVRTLGTGTASAASRIAGIIVPLVGSALLGVNPVLALVIAAGAFAAVALAAVLLPRETRGRVLDDHVAGSGDAAATDAAAAAAAPDDRQRLVSAAV